jgi:PAS domain S-box-containing protein
VESRCRQAVWLAASEAIGKEALTLLVPERFRDQIRPELKRLFRGEGRLRAQFQALRKDGAELVCDWYNTPIRDAAGRVLRMISLAIDVSDADRQERARRTMISDLRAQINLPLETLRTAMEALEQDQSSTPKRAAIDSAVFSTQQLTALLRRLLEEEFAKTPRDNSTGATSITSDTRMS